MGIAQSTTQTRLAAVAAWSPSSAPQMVWSPAAAALLILAAGAVSLAAKQPWLVASVAATAFLQAHSPDDQSSRMYNAVVGHAIALVAAFLAVALVGAGGLPSILSTKATLASARVWASALAMGLTMIGQQAARAFHAPAAATALLITVGIYKPTPKTAVAVMATVLLIAGAGEGLRRVRSPDRRWHPF
jgi:HPP family